MCVCVWLILACVRHLVGSACMADLIVQAWLSFACVRRWVGCVCVAESFTFLSLLSCGFAFSNISYINKKIKGCVANWWRQNSKIHPAKPSQETKEPITNTIFSDVLYSPGIQSFPPLNRSFKFETLWTCKHGGTNSLGIEWRKTHMSFIWLLECTKHWLFPPVWTTKVLVLHKTIDISNETKNTFHFFPSFSKQILDFCQTSVVQNA